MPFLSNSINPDLLEPILKKSEFDGGTKTIWLTTLHQTNICTNLAGWYRQCREGVCCCRLRGYLTVANRYEYEEEGYRWLNYLAQIWKNLI